MGNKDSFKCFKNYLFKYKQIYFSLHSIEEKRNEQLFIKDYAKAVIKILNSLNVEKASFVCHSFGGRVLFKIHEINPLNLIIVSTTLERIFSVCYNIYTAIIFQIVVGIRKW